MVSVASLEHKVSKLVGAPTHVVFVEDAFCETPEEAWHATFEHLTAWREQRSARRDRLPKRQQIAFVAPRTVQEQDRWLA